MTTFPLFSSTRSAAWILAPVLALFLLTGCDSTDSMNTDDVEVQPEATAEMIAVSIAESNGGTADDLIAGGSDFDSNLKSGKAVSRSFNRECKYSDADQLWNCDVRALRETNRTSATFERVVQVQFRDADGQPQRNYNVDGQTAASMTYTILSGNGSFTSPRTSNSHTIPAGDRSPSSWTFDDLGTGTLTINGSGSRATTGEMSGRRGERVRNAVITTQAQDVVLQRGEGIQSGTLTGTYEADVTLTGDNGNEVTRTVSVEYEAVFSGGDVTVTFTGGGERFNGQSFVFNSGTGEPAS